MLTILTSFGIVLATPRSVACVDDTDIILHTRLFPDNSWIRQGCLVSPTLFNIFLERIMTDTLEDREGTVSIGGGTITNLRFADNINGLAGEEEELAKLIERLSKASTAYGMEISAREDQADDKRHQ